jgi:hypothetical protein
VVVIDIRYEPCFEESQLLPPLIGEVAGTVNATGTMNVLTYVTQSMRSMFLILAKHKLRALEQKTVRWRGLSLLFFFFLSFSLVLPSHSACLLSNIIHHILLADDFLIAQ